MIKIFKIGHLPYTPFDENFSQKNLVYLNSKGLKVTKFKNEADIFVAGNHNSIKKFMLKNPGKKNYLLWTNEPRFSKVNTKTYRPLFLFPKIHVMNVYTGDVFFNNVAYQQRRFTETKKLDFIENKFQFLTKRQVALMSFFHGGKYSALWMNGQNIDLIKKRSEIALYCYNENRMDIFGQGWPEGISKEDSRMNNRHSRKKEILKNYHFNFCFENTLYPYYITEKIWESIECKCLPIYYGGDTGSIYEIFPEKSFIDYSQFKNPQEMIIYIENMTREEFIMRMNKCIKVYNEFVEKPHVYWEDDYKKRLDNIVHKCKLILN